MLNYLQRKIEKFLMHKNFLLFLFVVLNIFPNIVLFTNKKVEAQTIESTNLQSLYPVYKLGISDRIQVSVFKLNNLDAIVKVLPDGTIMLPRLGSIKVSGLTLKETEKLLLKRYSEILKRPIIYLNLLETRPIKVTVIGEVQRPGIYTLSLTDESQISNSDGGESLNLSFSGWPSVVEAIQKAGGLSNNADLRKIILTRNVENERSVRINYNFWDVLSKGISIKNASIFDGDVIEVKKADKGNKEFNRLLISQSNFSPNVITVNVIGEVVNPGQIKVRANSPLSEALLAAGGLTRKANKKNLTITRLNLNGSIKNTVYSLPTINKVDDKLNPPLLDRDTIVIKKNNFANTVNLLEDITAPARSVIEAVTLYEIIQ